MKWAHRTLHGSGDGAAYRKGKVIEQSKEAFRQLLLNHFPDPDILLNKDRFDERLALAEESRLPEEKLMEISRLYQNIAEKITGEPLKLAANPKQEIIDILSNDYGIIN